MLKHKNLRGSHSLLGEAVLAHLLTFVIRARQRLLELDDWMSGTSSKTTPATTYTGGATWVNVQCVCERDSHVYADFYPRLTEIDACQTPNLERKRPRDGHIYADVVDNVIHAGGVSRTGAGNINIMGTYKYIYIDINMYPKAPTVSVAPALGLGGAPGGSGC